MKKVPISLLCGVAAIIITILLYFAVLTNVVLQVIHFISLVGIVTSEVITIGFAYFSKGCPRKVGAAIVSGLSIPIAAILSVVYIVSFPTGYFSYICWYLAVLISVNLMAVILYNFDSKKDAESVAFQEAKLSMLNMRKIVKLIIYDAAPELKIDLNELEEKLHYSNDSVIAAQDSTIYGMLVELRENIQNSEYDSKSSIIKISKAIDERNIICNRNI